MQFAGCALGNEPVGYAEAVYGRCIAVLGHPFGDGASEATVY